MSNHEDYSAESKTLADKKSSQRQFSKRSITLDCEDYADYFQKKMLSKKDSKNCPKKKPQKLLEMDKEYKPYKEDGPKKKRGRPSKEDKKGTKDGNPINFEKGRFQ